MNKHHLFGAFSALYLLAACSDNAPSGQEEQTSSKENTAVTKADQAIADRAPLDPKDDPYLWLEDVEGEKALSWVKAQNDVSLARLTSDDRFTGLEEKALARYNSNDKIAYASFMGDDVHNFWQDAANVRGLWRKASYDSYIAGSPEWETMLDFDALAEAEDENWVYKGRDCLKGSSRCLIRLSRGGGDAVVVREFDRETKSFVEGGFESPESKQWTAWVDEDTLMIATSFGDGTMNSSGYPTQVRLWKRGIPLGEAELLLEDKEVVFNFPGSSHRSDGNYSYIVQGPDFFTERLHLIKDGKLVRMQLPEAISFQGFYQGHMAIQLRKDWVVSDATSFKAGSLLLLDPAQLEETPTSADGFTAITTENPIESVSIGVDRIMLTSLQDVTGKLQAYDKKNGVTDIDMPANGSLNVIAADDNADRFFVNYEGHTTPDSLYAIDGTKQTLAYQLAEQFDSGNLVTEQHFATSPDGTKIPYFLVRDKNTKMDGTTPTMLYGYGGFEISLTPGYLNGFSSLWVENGGAYVVANIRGGGEYGPAWHQAALKEKRQLAYDDFIAVAEHLIASGLTSADHLGIRGGSNGGLLMGAMFTQRPDLFKAVICAVPLLDMYRYDKLLAGASWVGEYGDPDTSDWDFIKTYSPYQNVFADVSYPEVFFYTSTKDDRVHPGHARKMAARMMEQGHGLLYYENTEGGHAAAANLKQRAYTDALQVVYALTKLSQ